MACRSRELPTLFQVREGFLIEASAIAAL